MSTTADTDRESVLPPQPVDDPAAGAAAFERGQLEAERRVRQRRRILDLLRGAALLLVLGVVVAYASIRSPYFLTVTNLTPIAIIGAPLGIMVVLETLVVISGEIDISVGSVVALTSVLIGVMVTGGTNVWLATFVALLCAAGVGLLNGLLVVVGRFPSLVATLATYSIFLGLAYVLSNSATVLIGGQGFQELGSGKLGPVPVQAVIFLVIWALAAFVARFTPLGRHVYATGDNYNSARRAGIRVSALRIGLFVTLGLGAGLAGVIVTSELGSAAPQIGDPFLISVVTGVVLGGASLRGGRGTMTGALVAVIILACVENGFALLQVSSYAAYVVRGCLLVLAVGADQLFRGLEGYGRSA